MATCCIHCGVEEGELHASDCTELRSAFERIERERDELQHRLERWQRNEVQFATNQQVARLIRERDEAIAEIGRIGAELGKCQAEIERLREDAKRYRWLRHHYTAAVKFAHPKVIVIDDAAIDEAMRESK